MVVGLLPCAACQDEFVETFELPVVGGEVGGEPVEEIRVGGAVAEGAEVAGGGDETAAEVVEPEAVDEDAWC